MARKWLRNGALASVFAMFAMGIVGTPTGSLVSAAYARQAVSADMAVGGLDTVPTARLPREAVTTLGLIGAGGPYPYEKDGVTYHRARFAGFESKKAAQRACSQLQKQNIHCYAVMN